MSNCKYINCIVYRSQSCSCSKKLRAKTQHILPGKTIDVIAACKCKVTAQKKKLHNTARCVKPAQGAKNEVILSKSKKSTYMQRIVTPIFHCTCQNVKFQKICIFLSQRDYNFLIGWEGTLKCQSGVTRRGGKGSFMGEI